MITDHYRKLRNFIARPVEALHLQHRCRALSAPDHDYTANEPQLDDTAKTMNCLASARLLKLAG